MRSYSPDKTELVKKTLHHLRSFFFLLILLLLARAGVGQVRLQGVVKSFGTSEVVPYVNIVVVGKKGGAYSDEEGRFMISVDKTDSLVFSSVGYKRLTIAVQSIIHGQVFLQQDLTILESVTVNANKEKVKTKSATFGYINTSRRSLISAGIPGIQFAVYIENTLRQEGYIEEFLLGIRTENKARIRIRLYTPSNQKGVGEEITKQNLLFDVSGNHKSLKLDVAKYNLPFPKEGIIVAVEFLGEVGKDNNILMGTTSVTKLYLTDGNDKTRNTWESYREHPFVKESFSVHQQNTSNALVGLVSVFYQED